MTALSEAHRHLLPTVRRLWTRAVQAATNECTFLRFVVRRALDDRVMPVAASLSYTSLIALVPLLAIGLAIFSAFPAFNQMRDQIQRFIINNFLPSTGEAVEENLIMFVEATDKLTAVGVVGLAVTAVMLLVTIEDSFNLIFRVGRARSVISRLLVYWTVVTLGPMLVGASFSLSGYLGALDAWVDLSGAARVGLSVTHMLPTVLTVVAFSLIYIAVPNRPVKARDALIGGICAAILFAGLRDVFNTFVVNQESYRTVYGALATLPLFLLWMYASWTVVLIGAVLTAALPEWRAGQRGEIYGTDAAGRLALAVAVLGELSRAGRTGIGLTRADILRSLPVPEARLMGLMRELQAAHVIDRTEKGRWVVTRDLEQFSLHALARLLDVGLGVAGLPENAAGLWTGLYIQRIEAAAAAERGALNLPVAQLIRGSTGPSLTPITTGPSGVDTAAGSDTTNQAAASA